MPTDKFRLAEISALLVALKENANDPATFSKIRAKVLALNFEISDGADREKLQQQQAQIDAMVAVNGFNQASVKLLLNELEISANLLNTTARRLDN